MDFFTLKELCNFEKGCTGLAKAEPGDYPLVATSAARKSCNTYQFDTKAVCIPLVSSTGHGHASLNNVHYQEGKFALGTILVALTNKDENRLNIQFLHLYLSQLKDQILVPLMSGGANVALSVRKIQNVEIPLPSIERQREIVENFKSIVIEEGQLKSELTHQQVLLKKLRQQILQEAIEGKLTADWRKQNPDIDPASKLLERISIESDKWVEKEKKNGYKEATVIHKKLQKLKKVPPRKPNISVPNNWVLTPLLECMKLIVDCHNKTASYKGSGIKLVRTSNIRNGELDLVSTKYVSDETYKFWSKRAVPAPGDILYTREAPVGEVAIIPDEEVICMGQRMMLLRPFHELIDKKFVLFALMEPSFLKRLENLQKGATVKHLRVGDVENAFILLPPLVEQNTIVTKIEKLLALCDQLEIQITQNQTHAEQLMQAVLKEAFQSESPTTSSKPKTRKPSKTQNQDNLILFNPTKSDYDKRTLLAAEVVHQLHREPTLGHLKLQKLIYLCQKIERMQLPTNFLQQAAGPYDPEMARSLDKQLKDNKWFRYQREEKLKYIPLENAGEHRADFDKYFAEQKEGIHSLINLFRKEKSDHMEIVATLYACWERLLQEKAVVSDEMIFERFYQWSEEKSKYPLARLKTVIEKMCKHGIVPKQLIIGHI